ncbi:MAG: DUF3810 domain-containing protein [Tissierellia bacterium]|nr:DUF3810 domain-containing protein [Tissierellia bacterium]
MKYNRLLFLILIPISFILTQAANNNVYFAEYYSTKIYPKIAQTISFFTSLFSFSLTEILIILLIFLIIIYTITVIIKTINDKSSKYIKEFIINLSVIASIIYFLFVLFCGLNYYRFPFTVYSELEIKESSKEELILLCENLIEKANYLRTKVKIDEKKIAALDDENYYETARRAQYSFNKLSNTYEILTGNYPKPKPVLLSKLMSEMNITGVFFPFTFESNVNIHIPSYTIPSTMCHELSHIRGFMREDEANFISYLACVNSGYDDFAYSGTMLALTYSMNALYMEDYDAFESLYHKYSGDVYKDIKYKTNYWKQFETKVAEISTKVNDTYLKANNQDDGVRSYGRMVDLLLAEQRQSQN